MLSGLGIVYSNTFTVCTHFVLKTCLDLGYRMDLGHTGATRGPEGTGVDIKATNSP